MTTPEIRDAVAISQIQIDFGAPVEMSREHEHRLVSLIGEICDAYEETHPDRVHWPAGIGSMMSVNPLCLGDDEPLEFDDSTFHIDCCERERFEDEKRGPRQWTFEQQVIAEAIDKIGWPEINAFQAELSKGQSIDEDAGGFMVRAIARLFRIRRRRDPVVTYQDAARALFEEPRP